VVFVNKHYLYISYADGKPFILIAGQYDAEYSHEVMLRASPADVGKRGLI
jgi:hypothetical protein